MLIYQYRVFRCLTIILIFGLFNTGLHGQSDVRGIGFYDISIATALDIAKRENKNIFIDTYAEWCVPCKSFERELRIPEVSAYFNNNYINVKIDVDKSQFAKEYKAKYGIVFLPTIVLLDQSGEVKYTIDKFISGLELKAIADAVTDPNFFVADESAVVASNPFGTASVISKEQQLNEAYVPAPTPEIKSTAYYSGQSGANPLFLKKEAYFRLGLGDGSHKRIVDNYLDTQEDWTTPDNVRFIFDFLDHTKFQGFQFLLNNPDLFNQYIDHSRMSLSLKMILHNEGKTISRDHIYAIYKILSPDNAQAEAENYISAQRF